MGCSAQNTSYNTAQNYPTKRNNPNRNNVQVSKTITGYAMSNQDDAFMKGNDDVTSPPSDLRNQVWCFHRCSKRGTTKGRGSASQKGTTPTGVSHCQHQQAEQRFRPRLCPNNLKNRQDRIRRRGTCREMEPQHPDGKVRPQPRGWQRAPPGA